MKVLTTGHKYELDSMEGTNPQTIQFIQKVPGDNFTLITVNDGTTNEEVMKVLIDRLKSMGRKLPCKENAAAIYHLSEALSWLEARTAKRQKQGVENKMIPHEDN